MQNKKEKFLDKIVKKDYNNELETVIENKDFDESAKNLLLSIIYKIEAAYKDYQKVKRNVKSKENYIEQFIKIIDKQCKTIRICNINSNNEKLKNKTFFVNKKDKEIISYPIERKLLYCVSKINKNDIIVKPKYNVLSKTLSDLINTGNNIDTVEPLRDFNGYSWTTVKKEIESISHNLIYQNLRMLVGYEVLEKWVANKEFIIDYLEWFKVKLDELYGITNEKQLIELIEKVSVLLEIKYDQEEKEKIIKEKEKIKEELTKIKDKENFIKNITKQKIKLNKEIKVIDETINDKELLQKEYIKRNEKLPLKKKIFSARILSNLMIKEREEKILEIDTLNMLLNPQKFIVYQKELEEKYKYLKLVETKDIDDEIEKILIKIQKVFLKCYKKKVKNSINKTELINIMYEFRYYNLLPYDYYKNINDIEEIEEEKNEIINLILRKARELKIMPIISKKEEINNEVLKHIFSVRAISLEEIYIKIVKEKEQICLNVLDNDSYNEKILLDKLNGINKKDLEIKINKKIKIFE